MTTDIGDAGKSQKRSATGAGALLPRADGLDFFNTLVDWWRRDTAGLSSPSEKAAHPAYQLIIQMGERVVPFILMDLEEHGGDWYVPITARQRPHRRCFARRRQAPDARS